MMAAVLAALSWARLQGYIDTVPAIRRVQTGKIKSMKGRPITAEEFERMLSRVPAGLLATPTAKRQTGTAKRKYTLSLTAKDENQKRRQAAANAVAESWRHLLRGLWASALRLDEAMQMSWDIPGTITPEWPRNGWPP